MSTNESNLPDTSFDLFRISKGKKAVDVCANTLREYHEQGLQFYRRGKAVFVSKSELAMFIRSGAAGARNNACVRKVVTV